MDPTIPREVRVWDLAIACLLRTHGHYSILEETSGEQMKFVPSQALKQRMEDLVTQSDEIDIAVAWVSRSPNLSLMLEKARSSKAKIRMVTGVGGYLTEPPMPK
jgi:hypothetical protein